MRELVIRPPGPESRFKREWKWEPENRRLHNRDFGVAYQVVDVVYDDTGEVHHEGVILLSRRIELHVVARQRDGHIGFVFHRREKVIPPAVSDAWFEKEPGKFPDIFSVQTAIEEYECPHGLALNRLEEVLEEIGLTILDAIHIGHVKDSPPLGGVAHALFAVMVGDKPSGQRPDAGEQIRHVDFFPPEEVRTIQTICALTQGALWRFRCWGLEQEPGSFWRSVAARL